MSAKVETGIVFICMCLDDEFSMRFGHSRSYMDEIKKMLQLVKSAAFSVLLI